MKEPHSSDRFYQERDTTPLRTPSLAMGACLVIAVILSAIGWGVTRASLSERRPFDRFPERQIDPRGQLPEVRSTLIDQAAPGLSRKRRDQDILRSYGWVDPRKDIVRIPIDQAMDLVASGVLPGGRAKGQTP